MKISRRIINHEMDRIDQMTEEQALLFTKETDYFNPEVDNGVFAKIEPLVIKNPQKIQKLMLIQMQSFKALNPKKRRPYLAYVSMLDARGTLFYDYTNKTEEEIEDLVLSGKLLPKSLVVYTLFCIDMNDKHRRSIHLGCPYVFVNRQATFWLMKNFQGRFFFGEDKELMKEIKNAGGEVHRFPLGRKKVS
ncbi:hypothetical protein KMW28_26615 [Flammeovirga yaeyamensis]|uniref:Uncharacterized protein n=1 Tax=Flammeovirga yaeyamensis TaxID=367791 RepID=A0AAX1NBA6_9BACT|nr:MULTISPECIES: hypothetical protein [Flammeovirga]ANQ52241.2 hypothetical protein MY04_4906 [Flammeovirga sp. MY04]MBB3701368.1 hypothetical protein [Flammeovirga yaeyamensis]NMF38564.1 hypothetical protein [Flammeovirga yaeyamensis]QWG04472.1 hypothetical protein KMW28_26615 [Flammeovirga yaeyamensis]